MRHVSLLLVGCLLSAASLFAQTIRYVKPGGSGNGSSWANASGDLMAVINGAGAGDQVWVAKGTYKPTSGTDRGVAFYLKNNVTIYGGFAGTEGALSQRDIKANSTILSGDIGVPGDNSDNSFHVIYHFFNGLNETAVLDGFTITGGNANGTQSQTLGGGAFNWGASPTYTNCLFTGNNAGSGGGMFNDQSNTTLINCSFTGNTSSSGGGGVYNQRGTNKLINCSFSNNNGGFSGGGITNSINNKTTLTNCSFAGNIASRGGGMNNNSGGIATLTNCIFWDNSGGEILTESSAAAPTVTYSIVKGGYTGAGNRDADPLFVSVATNDLRLQACTPALNTGDNNADLDGTDAGTATISTITTDLSGNPRSNGVIDMGAFELQESELAARRILYVNAAVTTSGDGSSWTSAFKTLQEGLAQANTCQAVTQVWVAKGTYKPTAGNDRNAAFSLKNNVTIYGGFAGTETALLQRNIKNNATILSGDIGVEGNNSDNSYHIIYHFFNGLDSTAVLDGFTVTGGNANGGTQAQQLGGGAFNWGASPTYTNCLFTGNNAGSGGGMVNDQGSTTLINCSFIGNVGASGGGGLLHQRGTYRVINCAFANNNGGYSGGGFFNTSSTSTLINCSFGGNQASYGGAIYGISGSILTLTNCILWDNAGGEITMASSAVTPTVTYSIVKGGYSGVGNRNINPLFVDLATGNLRLKGCSPAIAAGQNSGNSFPTDVDGLARIIGTTIDMGAFEYEQRSGVPTDLSRILKLEASKGYFPDRTELRWTVQGTFDNFFIRRAPYGTTNFIQIAVVPGSSAGEYQTDDSKALPGVYYTYQITGVVKCNEESIIANAKDTLRTIGFRSPTGTVYGRITYENGQSVEDVMVRLESADAAQVGRSILLDGTPESYLRLDSTTQPFSNTGFTIEAWIKPTDAAPANQMLFYRNGHYSLGFNQSGQIFFSHRGEEVTAPYANPNNSFVHVAAIRTADSLYLLLNGDIVGKLRTNNTQTPNFDKEVFIGRSTTGHWYKGLIDELRLYNVAVSPAQIARNYTRLFAGNETGLIAYWRFDETISDQFYDLSFRGDVYNRNDGAMNPAAVQRSTTIPTNGQLAFRAFTDVSGNYSISGIPYVGNGTTYTIVPAKGTHQFDPISVNRLFSPSTSQFTVDFTDKSSFNVSGFVYYRNSTVPVPGVFFRIDGQYAQQSNGDLIQTDETGAFTISVPVGIHEVRAEKQDHRFANGGKITDLFGRNLDYQDHISRVQLTDTTTIRFIGRVAGGAVQADQPLGHSVSVNNLGKDVAITLELPSGTRYRMRNGNTDSLVTTAHFLPANATDPTKVAKSKITYKENSVVINPDPKTGEFVADLIPVQFLAKQVMVTGWGDLLDNNPVTLDFVSKFIVQSSVRNYTDSTYLPATNSYSKTAYTDSLTYNASHKFIKRVQPSVAVVQQDENQSTESFFGSRTYASSLLTGRRDTILVVDTLLPGMARYKFSKPVFVQNQPYNFQIRAFESYPYYTTATQITATDNVPTTDGLVSVLNSIRDGATTPDTMSLNQQGRALYTFFAGEPNLASGGVKDLAITVQFGQSNNVVWEFNGEPKMEAYVLGSKMTGTDFVTAGPDKILAVLRDPPGSKSFSFMEKGSVIARSETYSGSVKNEGSVDLGQVAGVKMVSFVGFGAGLINKLEATVTNTFTLTHEAMYTRNNTKETVTTLNTRFQTSDDPSFAGPDADVFVGYSTNITYGASNNVTIIRRTEKESTDEEISAFGDFLLIKRSGINIGERFGTLFAFPARHIEKILIPNLIRIRNTLLKPSTLSDGDAQALANSSNQPVYVSKLALTDPKFGKSNRDAQAFGLAAKTSPFTNGPSYKIFFPANSTYLTDTIRTLNQYVANWEQRLADNEEAKLKAELEQNYSFQSGSPISYSTSTAVQTTNENSFSFVVGGVWTNTTAVNYNDLGFEFEVKESLNTTQGGVFTNTRQNNTTLGFTLASAGTDDYFSVDVKRAADSSFVFRTKGGVSACPYMGAVVTKYYEPGRLIDQPTQRAEVPVITVDRPVATNVPSSRKAVYTLTIRNESEARLPASFVIGYTDNDSIRGATLAIDGATIGGSGRTIAVPYGETITKVLTLTKGPEALDYRDIQILLKSGCQYDPIGYVGTIADTVLISAHFIPSCSDINLKSPTDKWVLNTESPVNQQGKRYLPVSIDQFDVNNTLFDHIALQYKPASSATWITTMKFYHDPQKLNAAEGPKQLIVNPAAINYDFVLDDGTFSDQAYDIRAVGFCKVGAEFITTESNLIAGVKDTYNPRLFGSPQPANGILTLNDEVRLNFNETLAAGLLTPADFQVTGIRNGSRSDHSVSVRLDGVSSFLATEFEKNYNEKSITAELWVQPAALANGTVFSHGGATGSLELALTSDRRLQVTVGGNVVTSVNTLPGYTPTQWMHVALVYNHVRRTITAFANFTEVISGASVSPYTGTGRIEFGRIVKNNSNYFNGNIRDARIWSDTLTGLRLQINSMRTLSGAEPNLIAYYPMNEGKGKVALDKAYGSHAAITGQWSTPAGKAVSFASNGHVRLNTSFAPVTSAMDYTLELWFKADANQANATLASNGKGDGTDPDGSLNLFSLGFEGGLLTFRNNGFRVQATGNYLDNNWHHVAVAVNRNGGTAQLSVDGQLNQFWDSDNIGGLAAAATYLGARAYFTPLNNLTPTFDQRFRGQIDEFRIWNTYLSPTVLANGNNVRLQGTELGLLAYYPFETYIVFQGVTQLYYSLKDAKVQEVPTAVVPDATVLNATETNERAPVKDRGAVENLKFDFVVNNDALILNVLEPRQSIDKTIITFQMKNARDANGNKLLSPITWSAYVDRNQLKWADRELNLEKELNKPLTFSSHLVNSGGNPQQYRVYNLPSWLQASPTSGSVNPTANQKVTFTVNEALNIGSYEEIIYVRNDNDEIEALKLTLQVKGKKPDWTVKVADYDYNMVVYGKLRFNSVFSINKEDMIAAFSNGKCVGVANNSFNASNNLWYTFLTVYSNTVSTANLEFRIWQASTGRTFVAVPSRTIAFANNAIIGTVAAPVIFDGATQMFQDLTLNQNWNWVSFSLLIPTGTPLSTTLQNGNWTNQDIIKFEGPGNAFADYSTGAWAGGLRTLNNLSLYKLKTGNAQTVPVSGTPVNVRTTAIPVRGGQWNFISYLPQVNATVREALAGYSASDEDVIKSQTGFAMYSRQTGWVGSLTYLEPGKGYMLFRKQTTSTAFFYPAIIGSIGGRVQGAGRVVKPLETPVPANFSHADNMTATVSLPADAGFRSGDILVAFVNGELRGKAVPVYNPETKAQAFFFTIGGDREQPVVFVIQRRGEAVAQSTTILPYQSDAVVGTLAKPLELQFAKTGSLITVYPNPFNQTTTLSADLRSLPATEHEVKVTVVDLAGRLVLQQPARKVMGTGFTTTWDGRDATGKLVANGVYLITVTIDGKPTVLKLVKQ